jgi:hypothetical protein
MKSMFDTHTGEEMISRINKLTADTKAQWGKMTPAQMVTHAQRPFKVAFEELKLKRGLIGVLFGGMARKKMTGSQPFGKNLPTDPNFIVKTHPDFDLEKNNLIGYVKTFAQKGPPGITKEPHPFFGKMTAEEWDTLMYKHLDHHLRQFGV